MNQQAEVKSPRGVCCFHCTPDNSAGPNRLAGLEQMDLNVIIENFGQRDSDQVIKDKISRCRALGFKVIALSVVVEIKGSNFRIPEPPNVKSLSSNQGPYSLKVYSRLTLKVSDSKQLYNLKKETPKYDLLALEPQNPGILTYISTGDADLDILTLDLSGRLDYSIFKTRFKVLEERGVCVEINYGPAQQGSSLRRNIVSNGQNLAEKTTKTVILSNGVSDVFRLRGPKDAQSIGTLFLMPVSKCHDAVYNNGKKAINLARARVNPTSRAIEEVAQV